MDDTVFISSSNNQIHLTVKSVTPFAVAKAPPLFTSSDLGVRLIQNGRVWLKMKALSFF